VEEHHPFESELIARTGWLIRLRWLAVLGMLLVIGVAALWLPDVLPLSSLLAVTAFISLYNLLFLLYLRNLRGGPSGSVRLKHATRFAYVQIILDLAALSAALHFAGGAENPMALFFVFHVIIASILLSLSISFLMAGLASLLFLAVAGLEYAGVLPHYHLPIFAAEHYQQPLYLFASFATLTVTLFLVTYLTTSITVQLRARDRDLLQSNLTCQIRSVELESLNEQLQRIDKERTRFIVMVTHELRAPINTVYSALELALSGYAPPEKVDEVLARAQRRVTELLDLIRDLLDLANARQQADQQIQASPIQLASILHEVVDFVRIEAEEKNLILELDVETGLAPVRILPDQAKVVWTNLLSNAIKYTEARGRVQVRLSQDERQVTGIVRDTGIGISPEELPHVFDEFFRAGNARSVSPHGTGVGMAVVRRIMENWGGNIRVESTLGVGTIFTFVLPRADSQSS
jgi:signal transduction histidine kinase